MCTYAKIWVFSYVLVRRLADKPVSLKSTRHSSKNMDIAFPREINRQGQSKQTISLLVFMIKHVVKSVTNYRVKSWIMVFVIICIVPYGLLIVESGMDLHWAIYALQVMTSPFLPPVVLAVTWAKATGPAVIIGTLTIHFKVTLLSL